MELKEFLSELTTMVQVHARAGQLYFPDSSPHSGFSGAHVRLTVGMLQFARRRTLAAAEPQELLIAPKGGIK
jgi:hypothetical protein